MSNSDYFDDEDSQYCYPGTHVLRNKMGLRDERQFSRMESTITGIRMLELDSNPQRGTFDLTHLKTIHRRIFEDIFEWAGEIRTVDISKSEIQFCCAEYIEDNANRLFKKLAEERYLKDMDEDVFIQRLAYYFSEINVIHPFREGNGRTQRKFIEQLAREADHPLTFRGVSDREMIYACEYAMCKDESKLEVLLRKCIDTYDRYYPETLFPFEMGLEEINSNDDNGVKVYYNRRHKAIVFNSSISSLYMMGTGEAISSIESSINDLNEYSKRLLSDCGKEICQKYSITTDDSCYMRVDMEFSAYCNLISNRDCILNLLEKMKINSVVSGIVIHMSPASLDGVQTFGETIVYVLDTKTVDGSTISKDVKIYYSN